MSEESNYESSDQAQTAVRTSKDVRLRALLAATAGLSNADLRATCFPQLRTTLKSSRTCRNRPIKSRRLPPPSGAATNDG